MKGIARIGNIGLAAAMLVAAQTITPYSGRDEDAPPSRPRRAPPRLSDVPLLSASAEDLSPRRSKRRQRRMRGKGGAE